MADDCGPDDRVCRCRICEPGPTLDALEKRVLDDVAAFGWHVVFVPGHDGIPGWAFTVGMSHSYGWPELIMTGLRQEQLHGFLGVLAEMASEGQDVRANSRIGDVIDGKDIVLREVHPDWAPSLLGWARWFEQHREPEAVQVVWPDNEGRLPGEPGFSTSLERFQPDLTVRPWEHRPDAWRAWASSCMWPTAPAEHDSVRVCRAILEDDVPVLSVALGPDRAWWFLDTVDETSVRARSVEVADVLDVLMADPLLDELIVLPPGRVATRSAPGRPWQQRDFVVPTL